MKLKQISPWSPLESIKDRIANKKIISWLSEKGPITQRIKKNGNFKLHLIQDELSKISEDDKKFVNAESEKIKKERYYYYATIYQ